VAPDRRLVREGPIQYCTDKNKTLNGHLYLMNDLLLITTISTSSSLPENVINVFSKGIFTTHFICVDFNRSRARQEAIAELDRQHESAVHVSRCDQR
jgi:hypothetical protein